MIGATFFGPLLTPVFFTTLRKLGKVKQAQPIAEPVTAILAE
jgi:hypothetical protein